MKVFIKILRIIAGIILGLGFSFLTIVCLDAILPNPNPFGRYTFNFWLIALVITIWVFFFLWLFLRKPPAKKIQTQGIELLPRSISELIDGIIDAMKYRRSVRAEVRQELSDHFTDALVDCENEQEKENCVKELIEEFGDIELLGKLLRRAKKRCRPLWRTMMVGFFQLIGICFVLLVLYIGWFFTGKPQVTINYLEVMNQQVRPVADDSQNAWPFYKQAAEIYEGCAHNQCSNEERFDLSLRNLSDISEDNRQEIQRLILKYQDCFKLIRKGNQKPFYWQTYGQEDEEFKGLMSVLLPHLSSYVHLSQLLCWQSQFMAEKGDIEAALDNLFDVYVFGRHLRGQKTTLIEQIVAMRTQDRVASTMQIILFEHTEQLNSMILNNARERFSSIIKSEDFAINFEFEKLALRDEAQWCFTESHFGKSHLYLPRIKFLGAEMNPNYYDIGLVTRTVFYALFTHPDKEETLEEIEQFYSEMQKMASLTPASAKSQGLDLQQFLKETIEDNFFLSILMPNLDRTNQIAYQHRIECHATLAILAILEYENQNGKLPDSLKDLVPKNLLKEVPIDPFSDKPLVYKKTQDDFTLYSVGTNLTDDGGVQGEYEGPNRSVVVRRWADTGDAVFWPLVSKCANSPNTNPYQ